MIDTPSLAPDQAERRMNQASRARWRTLAICAGLLVEAVVVLAFLHRYLTRPFGYDEQWRAAWVALGPRIASRLHEVPAPMTAGFVGLEWLVFKALPVNELTLRLPMLVAVPGVGISTYFLVRRWIGDLIAGVTAALLIVSGPVVVYGILMKPFVAEAMAAVVMLLVWMWADEPERSSRGRLLAYVGIGLLTAFAATGVFVLVPLVVYDASLAFVARRHERSAAARSLRAIAGRLAPSALALLIAGVHYVVFLAPQDHLLHERDRAPNIEPYWQKFFVPHDAGAAGFVLDRLRPLTTALTDSFLPPDDTDPYLKGTVPTAPWTVVVVIAGIVFATLLVWGIWRAARHEQQRVLVVVSGGSLLITLAASFKETWPFGLVRANLLLLPIAYALAAIGAADLIARARARAPAVHRAVVIALAATIVLALGSKTMTVIDFERRVGEAQFVDRTRDEVGIVRANAGPDDAAIVVVNEDGWRFYSFDYDDPRFASAEQRVSGDRTLLTEAFNDPAIPGFLRAHPDASRIFVSDLMGISGPQYDQQVRWLRDAGFCPHRRWDFPQTGLLIEFTRAEGNAACPPPSMEPVVPLE